MGKIFMNDQQVDEAREEIDSLREVIYIYIAHGSAGACKSRATLSWRTLKEVSSVRMRDDDDDEDNE